jgi:hypothetical protein
VVIIVARNADSRVFETLGNQFFNLGRFHWTQSRLQFRGRAV